MLKIKTAEQRQKEREAIYAKQRKEHETRVIKRLDAFMNNDVFQESTSFEMRSPNCKTCPEQDFFVKLQTEIGCTAPIEKANDLRSTLENPTSSASGYVCTFENYGSSRWFNVKEDK